MEWEKNPPQLWAALVLIVTGVWRFFVVFWRDIVIPIRERYLKRVDKFFDKLEERLEKTEERDKRDDSATRRILASLEMNNEQLKELRKLWEQYKDLWLQSATGKRPRPPRSPPSPPSAAGGS